MELILGMAKEMSKKSNRAWQAAHTVRTPFSSFHPPHFLDQLEKMIQTAYVKDEASLQKARAIGRAFLSQRNGDSQHQIVATGHCHIDTAWLWTYSETRRKVARSWSTQLTLAKHFPGYVFAASQAQVRPPSSPLALTAQQFEWLKQNYPELFSEIQAATKAGSFYPTGLSLHLRPLLMISSGGTWVEMDCNIPSGESLVRQFLLGQRFFEAEFGRRCTEFWLPDTFGYSSQLPQIMRGCGIDSFLTQKLSWNLINKFPHNTFWWQGLDGTRVRPSSPPLPDWVQVLSHFPPADTYCARGKAQEILFTVENFKNKDTSNNRPVPARPLLPLIPFLA